MNKTDANYTRDLLSAYNSGEAKKDYFPEVGDTVTFLGDRGSKMHVGVMIGISDGSVYSAGRPMIAVGKKKVIWAMPEDWFFTKVVAA